MENYPGIWLEHRLATGWAARFRFAVGETDFSQLHSVQAGSGAHPDSYPTGTGGGGLSPGVKRPGREADHSPPSTASQKR
jgi:hypothetical protein